MQHGGETETHSSAVHREQRHRGGKQTDTIPNKDANKANGEICSTDELGEIRCANKRRQRKAAARERADVRRQRKATYVRTHSLQYLKERKQPRIPKHSC